MAKSDYIRAATSAIEALVATSDSGLVFAQGSLDAKAVFASFFFARTTRNLSASVLLCGADHGIEAQALLRLLIEDMIEARYVASDADVLATRWLDHEDRTRYYTWLEKLGGDPDMLSDAERMRMEALIARDHEEARASAGPNASADKIASRTLKRRWTHKTMLRRAQIAQKRFPDTQEHHALYKLLCDSVHASAGLMSDYLTIEGDVPRVRMRAEGYKSATVATLSIYYAAATIATLSEFGLRDAPDVMALASEHLDFEAFSFDDLIR